MPPPTVLGGVGAPCGVKSKTLNFRTTPKVAGIGALDDDFISVGGQQLPKPLYIVEGECTLWSADTATRAASIEFA